MLVREPEQGTESSRSSRWTPRATLNGRPLPKCHFAVPKSLYGTVVFMPILVQADDFWDWLRWHGLNYFWMWVNFGMQALLLFGLKEVTTMRVEEIDPDTCEPLMPGILGPSLFACLIANFTDIEETYDIWTFVHGRLLPVPQTTMLSYTEPSPGRWKLQDGGMSCCRKVCVCLFILLPKLLLALALQFYSFWFLMVSTSNMDIILNATALVFIIQVDEALFLFFSLPEVRSVMDSIPDFQEDEEPPMAWLRPVWRLLHFLFCFATTAAAIITYGWCGNDSNVHLFRKE